MEFLQIPYYALPASQYTQYFSNFLKHCGFVKKTTLNQIITFLSFVYFKCGLVLL